jgi:hypothetical protein
MDIAPFNFNFRLYLKRDYSLRPSSLRYEGQARDPKEGGFKTKKSLLLRKLGFLFSSPRLIASAQTRRENKKPRFQRGFLCFGGERGIRTPGGVTLNSFQDCRIRPLCHFSC